MPLYDFKCIDCNHGFERLSKFDERHLVKCPECDGDVEQVIGRFNFIPFHSGYYEHFTDHPIHIGSKKQLKEACKKYDMGSVYLDDS